MGRRPCCDKATVKKGTWSPEEDDVLRNYVEKHGGVGNWISLPRKAGLKRCGKSCRLRWLNYLRPEIKRGNFTEEEENLIFSLYNEIGSRWSTIASNLPGRTDNDVKNLWNTKLKKRLPNRETTSLNFGKTSTSKAHQAYYGHGSSSSLQFTTSSNFGEKNDQHALVNSSHISESKPMIVSGLPSVSSSVEAGSSFSMTSSPLAWHLMPAPWSINEGDEEEDELLRWLFQTL